MTDTTPTPTPRERERIGRALQKAFAADPMDRMLQDYRPMTAADVLRFDVHWLGPEGRPGRVEPLHATDRMQVKPLRILRGFLHRLKAGFNRPRRAKAGEEMARHVTRPGHGFVTEITSGDGIVDGTGRMGDFAWNQALRRVRDGTLRGVAQDRICKAWGFSWPAMVPFWRGPSGPFAWLRPDSRFVLADDDGWGCPVLLNAVWRPENETAQGEPSEEENPECSPVFKRPSLRPPRRGRANAGVGAG